VLSVLILIAYAVRLQHESYYKLSINYFFCHTINIGVGKVRLPIGLLIPRHKVWCLVNREHTEWRLGLFWLQKRLDLLNALGDTGGSDDGMRGGCFQRTEIGDDCEPCTTNGVTPYLVHVRF
jgi:hypothetical protein